ncbi:MAG TPA: tetratricopeptide repeat protein [Anaeromyxobacteraceae bacterium]|nr:tetratricopeptide repeat protein [Anaeromyxobacteraceae bacterium]
MRPLARIAAAAAFLAGTGALASRLPVPEERPYDVVVVPPSSAMRWLALGHPTLVANFYYLRAVQYIGDSGANARGWDHLFPLVDLVTDLDPAHGYAYQVAGTLLGSVQRVAESNAILEKGMRNVPGRYILPYLRAFNAFYYAGDYAEAGRFVEAAARIPGAPAHLRQNVLAMYVKGRRADAAIAFLEEVRRATQDPEALKAIDEQIRRALLERDAALLDDAVARYRQRHGYPPLVLPALVADGLVDAIPEDPFGGVYVIGPDGRVRSSANPQRFAPPERPEQMPREPGVRKHEEYW